MMGGISVKRLFFAVILAFFLLPTLQSCSQGKLTFSYSAKNIDKLIYNFDYNKAAPRDYMDITDKADIDKILSVFGSIEYRELREPPTVGIIPLEGFFENKLIFCCFNDGSFLSTNDGKHNYEESPNQEQKLKTTEESFLKIIEELKSSGKYEIYQK